MSKNSVEIVNPISKGARFTSYTKAREWYALGIAQFTPDGKIRMTLENQEAREAEQEFQRNRGGVIFWNGRLKDPFAMKRPGEVVS